MRPPGRDQSRICKPEVGNRKSIAIAATLVVGASATTVGAYSVPATYFGSDTLFVVTQDAIGETPGLGPSLEANYLAGGSGAGQNTMAAATVAAALQQTAPMSKMMTNGVCNALGGLNGNLATNASGIVIGMDAVDLLSAAAAGGSTSCNGANDTAAADNTGFGSAYSGTTGVFTGSNANKNWKWTLALLYGGLDLSPGASSSPDCNSTARANLVANWSLLFETGVPTARASVRTRLTRLAAPRPLSGTPSAATTRPERRTSSRRCSACRPGSAAVRTARRTTGSESARTATP